MSLLRDYAERQSEAAFEMLVARYASLVYSAALRQVGDSHLAEEITQTVFTLLARKAGALSEKTILSGWLYRTTRHVAAAALKMEYRRRLREQEAMNQESTADPDWERLAPFLDDAMAKLREQDRDAIVMRYFQNKPLRDVGAAFGVDEYAAQKRVGRALEKLQAIFARHGITSTAAALAETITAHSVALVPAASIKTLSSVAITKGAVGSTSTLALIKGALKTMALTKMKTAAISGAAILVVGVSVSSILSYLHATPKMKLPTGSVTPMVGYGASHYAAVLASDGSLWSWGELSSGWPVLGLGNRIENTTSLRRIGKDKDWVSVAVGSSHSLAIKSDGTLWGWGANYCYQLGDGTQISRSTPVISIAGNDWKQVASGEGSSFALKKDGTLWAWGGNSFGELGIGSETGIVPKAVQVGASTNWVKVWAGLAQTAGLQSDGSLWFWGELSGNTLLYTNRFLVPTRMSSATNWVDASFGFFTLLAVKSDGTIWGVGINETNFAHMPGKNLSVMPFQVLETDKKWQSISSSDSGFYFMLREKDGSLWILDASDYRYIKPASEHIPLDLQRLDWNKDVAAYAAGSDNIGIALTSDGEVWTWGRVFGDHPLSDFFGNGGGHLEPKYKYINTPWQVSNIPE